ncbi:MAG: hypothetical protein RIA72_05065 [Sphingopyxis sp.]|uniref:hypothetical protein n=1 Tax=Sphingopyxis sp. TaxID=1908224 RepID=UPI0032EC6E11
MANNPNEQNQKNPQADRDEEQRRRQQQQQGGEQRQPGSDQRSDQDRDPQQR